MINQITPSTLVFWCRKSRTFLFLMYSNYSENFNLIYMINLTSAKNLAYVLVSVIQSFSLVIFQKLSFSLLTSLFKFKSCSSKCHIKSFSLLFPSFPTVYIPNTILPLMSLLLCLFQFFSHLCLRKYVHPSSTEE